MVKISVGTIPTKNHKGTVEWPIKKINANRKCGRGRGRGKRKRTLRTVLAAERRKRKRKRKDRESHKLFIYFCHYTNLIIISLSFWHFYLINKYHTFWIKNKMFSFLFFFFLFFFYSKFDYTFFLLYYIYNGSIHLWICHKLIYKYR